MINVMGLVGIDCPGCGARRVCEPDCVCPACWKSGRDARGFDARLKPWVTLSPVLVALNEAYVNWGWATSDSGGNSVEILVDRDSVIEIVHRGGSFIGELFERGDSNSWAVRFTIQSAQATEVAAWVTQCVRNGDENVPDSN